MNPCFLRGLVSRVSDFRARRGSGGGLHLSGPTLARWLRRAVLAIGVAGLLVLPQFTSNASFIGIQGLPGPLAVVFVGFVFWLMPILLMASWVAESSVSPMAGAKEPEALISSRLARISPVRRSFHSKRQETVTSTS